MKGMSCAAHTKCEGMKPMKNGKKKPTMNQKRKEAEKRKK